MYWWEQVVKLKEEQIATMESRTVEPSKITADGTPIAQEELFELLFTFSNVVKQGAFVREEEKSKPIPLSKIQERHKVCMAPSAALHGFAYY